MTDQKQNKYGYKMLYPSGEFYAYCSKKKYNKYINKNLCKIIDYNTIQLTFEPKKIGASFTYIFSINDKNKCSCCDEIDSDSDHDQNQYLNKHSIIPLEFLKHYPNKNEMSTRNIVLLCDNCKALANSERHKFRMMLLNEFGTKNINDDNDMSPGKIIVEKYISENKLNELSKRFMDHFISVMNPINLPDYVLTTTSI